MSIIDNGTRRPQTLRQTIGVESRHFDRSYSRDAGLAPSTTGGAVFSSSLARITLAGAFGAFAKNTAILVENTNLNNGRFLVTMVDPSGNFLTVQPPPNVEMSLAATVRQA